MKHTYRRYTTCTCTFEVKQCKVRKGKITPQLNRLPFPLAQINKKKGNIWVRTKRTNETNRKDQKPENKKRRDLPILAILLYMYIPLHKNDFISLALSHARTHARTTPRSEKKDSVHPSIHPFFLDCITQKGIPPRHKRKSRARNSRPGNQPVRERERYSFCLGHITEYDFISPQYDFISPQHASYQHTVLDAEAADDDENDDDGYPTNYIAPHPTRPSCFIHPFN